MKRFTLSVWYVLFIGIALMGQNAWINEIHYDNVGTDVDEFIEVVVEDAGSYTLSDFQVDLYNGSNGTSYDTKTLDLFTEGVTSNGFTIYYYMYPVNGIQNGAPDGMAISYQSTLISGQFLSYEGTFTAVDGPANGVESTDIGVAETSSTPVGESLQLTGNGLQYSDFIWTGPVTATAGNLNDGQTFGGSVLPEPTNYPTLFASFAVGVDIELSWTDATGAQLPGAYLILASDQDDITAPVDGTPVSDDEDLSDGQGAKNVLYGVEEYTFENLDPNTTYYFEIYPYTNSGSNIDYKTDGSPPESSNTTATVVLMENFDLSWGAWTAVSVTGDQEWDRDNNYGIGGTPCAQMSGYSGGSNENDDWLISPPMDLDNYTNEILTFYNAKNYSGPDMEVKVSTDYDGGGDPYSANWTTVSYTMSPGSWTWTASGDIDLSTYSGSAVYIAFHYTSTTSGAATWEVDDVLVTGDGPGPQDIVINEIMYNSPGDDEEWIELYNNTASEVDLSGWYIQDDYAQNAPLTLPGGTSIGPDEYFTIAVATSGSFPFTPDFDGTDQISWSLNNGGDEVNLYNLGKIQADHVPYDDESPWPAGPDGNGPSLSLLDPSYDNALPESWAESLETGGTPGVINFPPEPDLLVLTPNGGEVIEIGTTYDITWNELNGYSGDVQIDLLNLSTGSTQLLVQNIPSSSGLWSWYVFSGIDPGDNYKVRIMDMSGQPADSSDNPFSIAEPYDPAGIVITEIMYNPPESGNDSLEFLELYNNDSEMVNLLGYSFSEGVAYTFPDYELDPGEYFVVCIDSLAFAGTFGMSAYQWSSGALSNAGEDVVLIDSNGVVVDSVLYDDQLPWDTLADGFGPSLTFCNPNLNNALAGHWSASTEFAAVNANNDSIFASPFQGCTIVLPIPYFEAEDTTVAVGDSAIFTDLSLGDPQSWEWTFEGGDPAVSTQQDPPPVFYDAQGLYDVTLKVTNANGDSTMVRQDYISVDFPPVADFEASANTIFEGEMVEFTDLSTGMVNTWEWMFEGGDPASSMLQDPGSILYSTAGLYDVALTVSNDYGEDTYTREEYIDVLPVGIEEIAEKNAIRVFPNPNTGSFNIRKFQEDDVYLTIFNLVGEQVYEMQVTRETTILDMEHLGKGMYIIQVLDNNGSLISTQKLIIE